MQPDEYAQMPFMQVPEDEFQDFYWELVWYSDPPLGWVNEFIPARADQTPPF